MRRFYALTAAFLALSVHPAAATPAAVAVAFSRNAIRPVLAEGEADRTTHRRVGANDPVRIASISKLVTALGVMRMVDTKQLDLDRDVSEYLGWSLRNPAFPDRAITLRLLLSHQSSLLDGDDRYIIPLGTNLRERLAEPQLWDTGHAPGSGWFHYTNLNFPVVASIMERVSGERFDRLMQRLVMRPLRIDACYNWSGCSAAKTSRAVILYRVSGEVAKDDLHGRPPACPVMIAADGTCNLASYVPGWNGALFAPQSGLRISMDDLARIGQLLLRGGKGLISRASFAEMIRPQWQFDGANGVGENGEGDGFFCAYGLAIQTIGNRSPRCRDDLLGDRRSRIGHAGDAYGLKAGLWIDSATGRGMAYFVTAVGPASATGNSAFTAAEERMAALAATRLR